MGDRLNIFSVISTVAATTVAMSALVIIAAARAGARSEESLGVAVPSEGLRREPPNGER
jgi:hypothetical protein